MANWFDELFGDEPVAETTEFSPIDGDTYHTPEGSVRLAGANALEIPKYTPEGSTYGEVGGAVQAQLLDNLANKEGFDKVVYNPDEKDIYGRYLGDRVNSATGESLTKKALASGLIDPTTFTTPDQLEAALWGRLDRKQRELRGEKTDWDNAADDLNAYINANQPVEARPIALTEADYNAAPNYYQPGVVAFQRGDSEFEVNSNQTLEGKFYAKSQIGTGLQMGWTGIKEGMWGMWDMVGDVFGTANRGKLNIDRLRREQQYIPELRDIQAFDDNGNWQLDSVGKVTNFIFGNAAISAPYLIGTAAALYGGPVGWAGLGGMFSVYSGQTWNEQPEDKKNPALAMASGFGMAALDKLGLEHVIGGRFVGNFLNNPESKKIVVDQVAKKFKIDIADAEKFVANSSMRTLKDVSEFAKEQIAKQFERRYRDALEKGGVAALAGAAAEGITETGQELIQMFGSNNLENMNKQEVINRLMNAAVAGATLGGVLSGATSTYGQYKENLLGDLDTQADADKASKGYKLREAVVANEGANAATVDAQLSKVKLHMNTKDLESGEVQPIASLDTLAKPVEKYREKRGTVGRAVDFLKETVNNKFLNLFKGYMSNEQGKYDKTKVNGWIPKMFSILGGVRGLAGDTIDAFQNKKRGEFEGYLGSEEEAISIFKTKNINEVSNILKDKNVLNFMIESAKLAYYKRLSYSEAAKLLLANKDTDIKIPDEFIKYADSIITYGERLHFWEQQILASKGKLHTADEFGNLYTSVAFKKKAIVNDAGEFIHLLKTKGNLTDKQAQRVYNDITQVEDIHTFEDINDDILNIDIFSDVDTSIPDITHLKSDPDFAKYFETSLFYNTAAISGSTAARLANEKYIGKDGNILAAFIDKALKDGEITKREAGFIAAEIKDFIAIRQGKYKVIENPTWKALQDKFIFLTTLNQLTLSPLSSMVEMALIKYGVPKEFIIGKNKNSIGHYARSAAKEIAAYWNDGVGNAVTGLRIDYDIDNAQHFGGVTEDGRFVLTTSDRGALRMLGMMDSKMSQARRQDIGQGNPQREAWYEVFFQAIGLNSSTNLTRSLRVGLAADAIDGWISDYINGKSLITKQTLSAKEALINLGIDLNFLDEVYGDNRSTAPPMNQQQINKMVDMMKTASYYFVSDAVAHPTKANRPKFYQNPRTSLFFSFQGFLSVFTATILPKIYKNAFGTNTPAPQKLEGIQVIMTMIALGFLTQALRDYIKFGDEADERTAWLTNDKLVQRAIGASGLLGTGERFLNAIHPLYEKKSKDPLESLFNEISGEAPAVGYLGKVFDAGQTAVLKGIDDPSTERKLWKIAPGFGPLPDRGMAISEAIKDIFED